MRADPQALGRSHALLRALFLLSGFVLLSGCGGGSGGGEAPIPISSPTVVAPPAGYRADYEVSARIRVTGTPLPIDVEGTLTIEKENLLVAWPLDSTRQGTSMRHTLELIVPAVVRAQAPDLPETITVTLREFVEVAADGTWYALGEETEDVRQDPPVVVRAWWEEPLVNQEPTMYGGQVIEVPETTLLAEDLVTVLGTRASVRTLANQTELVPTPLGTFECFRAEVVETIQSDELGTSELEVRYERWERPDLGLVRGITEGLQYVLENEGQTYELQIDRIEARLVDLAP